MNLTFLMLMAGQEGKGGPLQTILMFAAIILVFYFFMIRPQRKRQKDEKNFREGLQKGQKIVTIGGLHGTVRDIKETTVIVEISNDIRVEIEKAAIASHALQKIDAAK